MNSQLPHPAAAPAATPSTSNMYSTYGSTVDPVITPPTELQAMLQSNAYRIADLVSQLEKSHAQLRRLRTRALKNQMGAASRVRKSPKASAPKSPRRTRLAPQQTASPTSVICDMNTPTTPNRGHWSVDEEARFDAASIKYGPTAYAQITAAVGSRTEKQVRDRAFRQRQKHSKAAEFAALSIPTVASQSDIAPTPVAVRPPPTPPPPSVPRAFTVQEKESDIALSDCSSSSSPKYTSSSKTVEPLHPRPTSPLSAVSTEFEMAILGNASATEMLDEALFEQEDFVRSCGESSTSFDWNCGTATPLVMESSYSDDAVPVPEFADNFLLLEHA